MSGFDEAVMNQWDEVYEKRYAQLNEHVKVLKQSRLSSRKIPRWKRVKEDLRTNQEPLRIFELFK